MEELLAVIRQLFGQMETLHRKTGMKLTYLRIIRTILNQRQPQGRKWASGETAINGVGGGGSVHGAQCRMGETALLETSC